MYKAVLVFILTMFLASPLLAERDATRGITSYGEHCQLCGEYGYCARTPTREEAVNAFKSYYEKRGLRVLLLKQKERFLEAEVYRSGNMVDRILLDLKTGRIRSIY